MANYLYSKTTKLIQVTGIEIVTNNLKDKQTRAPETAGLLIVICQIVDIFYLAAWL